MGGSVPGRVAGPEVRCAALGRRVVRTEGTKKPPIQSGAKTLGKSKRGRESSRLQVTTPRAPPTSGGWTCVRSPHGAPIAGRAGTAASVEGAERLTSEGLLLSAKHGLNDLALCIGKMEQCDPSPSASGSFNAACGVLIPVGFSWVSRALSPFRRTRSSPRLCSFPHLRPGTLLPLMLFLRPVRASHYTLRNLPGKTPPLLGPLWHPEFSPPPSGFTPLRGEGLAPSPPRRAWRVLTVPDLALHLWGPEQGQVLESSINRSQGRR